MAEELELMQTSCISSSPLLLFHWPLSADTLVVFPGNSYCCVVKCIHRRKLDLPFSLVLGLYLLQAPPPLSFSFPFNPASLCGLGQGALGSHSLHFLLGLHGLMSEQPKQHWYFWLQLL